MATTALVVAAALVFVAGSSPRTPSTNEAIRPPSIGSNRGAVTGSLVLPLTGTVQAGGLELGAGSDGTGMSKGVAPESSASGGTSSRGGPATNGASGDQSVDVPPGTGQTLDRLSTHVSPDGVVVSTFYAANTGASYGAHTPPSVVSPPVAVPGSSTGVSSGSGNSGSGSSGSGSSGSGSAASGSTVASTTTPVSPAPVGVKSSSTSTRPAPVPLPAPVPSPSPAPSGASCSPSGLLTLEMSDTQAVATFTEPFYGGYSDPLVDVEIGEFGVTEQRPATWVEAQVGPQAVEVLVQFADGATDSVAPSKGVAVLAHVGDASTTLGDGSKAYLEVLGAGGTLLARYSLGVGSPSSPVSSPLPPSTLPEPGSSQPSSQGTARDAVGRALHTALSCDEPPVAQAQAVYGGGAYEELGGAGSSGLAAGDRIVVKGVVFESSTSATVRYQVSSPDLPTAQTLYADATLVRGAWLLSLGSVAPGVQVAPANQDGDVSVAPGGPLFVHTGSGGVAVAVYRAESSTSSGSGCGAANCSGSPDPQCVPTGGTVEEITTPGAVGIESAPLFGNYSASVISVGLSIVGEAEGAPATVVSAEVGPAVQTVNLTIGGRTDALTPVTGVVDAVLSGAPATAIGPSGGSLDAVSASGATLSNIPLAVDASEPAPASSLPTTLPAAGTPPADPAAAAAAIDQVFETVFSCANSPLVRSTDIEDNGMFVNPLEQLYVGGYTYLVESVYATVNQVVFVDPTLADVSYTIRFRSDPTLTFDMIGSAVAIDGAWRVSYATLCAAVVLGGVSCSS